MGGGTGRKFNSTRKGTRRSRYLKCVRNYRGVNLKRKFAILVIHKAEGGGGEGERGKTCHALKRGKDERRGQ